MSLQNHEKLEWMEIPSGESIWAERALQLGLHIVSRRGWSLSKHSIPPESWAGLLSAQNGRARAAAASLKTQHETLLLLESRCSRNVSAQKLRRDLVWADAPAIRIIFEFFARDEYKHDSAAGVDSLMAHLWTLPDNKIVEDIHQPIRMKAKGQVNKKLAPRTIQRLIRRSNVIDSRGINHNASVQKQEFVKNFKNLDAKNLPNTYLTHTGCRRTRLPKSWSKMMAPRTSSHFFHYMRTRARSFYRPSCIVHLRFRLISDFHYVIAKSWSGIASILPGKHLSAETQLFILHHTNSSTRLSALS